MDKQAKIILFSCLYVVGILSAFYGLILTVGIIFLLCLCVFQYKKKYFNIKYFVSLIVIFLIGLLSANFHLNYCDDLTSFADNDVSLQAKVISIPSNSEADRTKFYAKAQNIILNGIEKENLNAKILITINDKNEKIKTIKIGDTLNLYGRLKVPNSAVNPSQFDYAKYLQYKNTFSLLYVDNNWEIISNANDFKGKLIRNLNDTRNKILDIHRQNVESPMIEVLGGIIFGDDAVNPDEDTKNSFIKSGIFHILAASGMNVTLIFGIWFFFAKNLRLNYRFSILFGIFLILVYTCMTGFGPPIIRAFLMLTLILIGKLIDKDTSTLSLLFIVGFLMLLYNPLLIFDIGFQLSFIVTFALILSSELIVFKSKYTILNYVLGVCFIPIIAQIYAAPLQMYYFNSFSLYSIFANIAIIPVLSFVSFVGFISSILALIPMWAQKICLVADIILNPFLVYIVKVADFFSTLPFSTILVKKPYTIQIVLYFTIIILATCLYKNKVSNKKVKFFIIFLFALFLLTFIPSMKSNTEIVFFSVGNSDAMLIKSPQNKYYILDTGKAPYNNTSSQAEYIIIKYLNDKGINKIDGLILSHFDSDHAGGTIDILQNIEVGKIYHSSSYEDTALSSSIINYINDKKLNYVVIEKEEVICQEKDFSLKLIKLNDKQLADENEKSIIALLNSKNKKVLFMGDGNVNTFRLLPQNYKENISLLKVGHHGAIHTVDKTMKSDLYVISTGANIYGHPHSQTLSFLQDKSFYRTDFHNAIKVVLDDEMKTYLYSPKTKNYTLSLID